MRRRCLPFGGPSYGSGMAQPQPTLAELYSALHQTDAEVLAARSGRVGSKWWDRRVAERQRLRLQIDALVKSRASSRRWWDPVP